MKDGISHLDLKITADFQQVFMDIMIKKLHLRGIMLNCMNMCPVCHRPLDLPHINSGYGMIVGNNGLVIKIDPTVGNSTLSTQNLKLILTDADITDDKGTGIPTNVNLKAVNFTDRLNGHLAGENGLVLKTTDGGLHWYTEAAPNSSTSTPLIAISKDDRNGTIINGTDVSNLSDRSQKIASRFWYDQLGRLTLSQNAKQFNIQNYLTTAEKQLLNPQNSKLNTPKAYSYTLFDPIGRIIEVGELITRQDVANIGTGRNESQIDFKLIDEFINKGYRRQITRTYYDEPAFTVNWEGEIINQTNLRTRVASVTYQESPGTSYDQGTHYSYDVHGKVKTLIQEIANKTLVKRLDYDYDLISGRVHLFTYQAGASDQFIHRYTYDANNRATQVETSTDGLVWVTEAKYNFYAHFGLARAQIGDKNVETQNFAYTLQGWIKGVDGQHFKYALGHNSNDYSPIGTSNLLPTQIETGKDLYSGNIATWASQNSATSNGTLQTSPWTQQFEYDQLNRINSATTLGGSNNLKSTYRYDANGNIKTLQRYDATGHLFDDITYNYQNTSSTEKYKENTNKLRSVDEPTSLTGLRADDIDDQDIGNYQYDEVGNLVFDKSEQIKNIEWTVSGKIKSVTREAASSKYNLAFTYDPMGNRVSKSITKAGITTITYYVRNSLGNILATYEGINLQEHDIYGLARLGTLKKGERLYELNDHLGNVRTIVSDNGAVKSALDYYPFGFVANSFHPTESRYGFNGKENDTETGTQDYGFRIYNPSLGRFLSIDPLVSKYPFYSPYHFAGNTPIQAVDLDGLEPWAEDFGNITTADYMKAVTEKHVKGSVPYTASGNYDFGPTSVAIVTDFYAMNLKAVFPVETIVAMFDVDGTDGLSDAEKACAKEFRFYEVSNAGSKNAGDEKGYDTKRHAKANCVNTFGVLMKLLSQNADLKVWGKDKKDDPYTGEDHIKYLQKQGVLGESVNVKVGALVTDKLTVPSAEGTYYFAVTICDYHVALIGVNVGKDGQVKDYSLLDNNGTGNEQLNISKDTLNNTLGKYNKGKVEKGTTIAPVKNKASKINNKSAGAKN